MILAIRKTRPATTDLSGRIFLVHTNAIKMAQRADENLPVGNGR